MPNEKGTTLYVLQRGFQSVFGFTLPLFHGRGLLNCKLPLLFFYEDMGPNLLDNFGLMPYRRTIVSVGVYCNNVPKY